MLKLFLQFIYFPDKESKPIGVSYLVCKFLIDYQLSRTLIRRMSKSWLSRRSPQVPPPLLSFSFMIGFLYDLRPLLAVNVASQCLHLKQYFRSDEESTSNHYYLSPSMDLDQMTVSMANFYAFGRKMSREKSENLRRQNRCGRWVW